MSKPTAKDVERATHMHDWFTHTPAPSPVSEEVQEESGWLIERNGKWWGPQTSRWESNQAIVEPSHWTADVNKAIRFSRKEDAEAFRRWEGLEGGATATEHIWLKGDVK